MHHNLQYGSCNFRSLCICYKQGLRHMGRDEYSDKTCVVTLQSK